MPFFRPTTSLPSVPTFQLCDRCPCGTPTTRSLSHSTSGTCCEPGSSCLCRPGNGSLAAHDAAWNRGSYLAEALAHCGDCHTPRNLLFATKSGRKYAGAIVDGWKAYNITSDNESGICAWSDEEIERYLSSGHAQARGSAGGGMAEAIDLSLRHLSSEDIAALTRYLRTIPAQRSENAAQIDHHPATLNGATAWSPGADRDESAGFQVFASACASCHGWDGNGQRTGNAGLRGSRSVNDPAGTNVVRAVLEGIKIGSTGGNNTMPRFANAYSDE